MANTFSVFLAFVPFVAALAEGVDVELMTRYGLLGIVLGWFMLRADKRLAGIEHKMGGLNRTMLIEILSRENVSKQAKAECRRELRKVAPDLAEEIDRHHGEG